MVAHTVPWRARAIAGLLLGLMTAPLAVLAQPAGQEGRWLVVLRTQDADVALPASRAPSELPQQRWQREHALRTNRLSHVLNQIGVTARGIGSAGNALRVDLPPGPGGDAAVRQLRLHPDVLDVVPNERLRRLQAGPVTPNDPLWSQQWHLQSASTHAGAANLPSAWSLWTGQTKPVNVAVVDTGVRYGHPDLAGRLLPGYDFVSEVDYANDGDGRDADASDPGDWVTAAESRSALFAGCEPENSSWHGTVIAGEIAAVAQNGLGVAGVNWGAQVVPIRVASKCGALLSDLLDGVRWAAGLPVVGAPPNPNPARIINLSYGGSGACNTAYQSVIDEVRAAGALVVVAAGNDGSTLVRPADCSGVLAVTGVRADGAKASYASYGSNVGLAAPGGSGIAGLDAGILSTADSGTRQPVGASYESLAGTSFSAPLAAGVASLVLGIQPAWTVAQLEDVLKRTARPHTQQPTLANCPPTALSQGACNCTTTACGSGLLDAGQAVAAAWAALSTGTSGGNSGSGTTGSGTGSGSTNADSGGGGAVGWPWGLGLWVWVLAVAWSRRNILGA